MEEERFILFLMSNALTMLGKTLYLWLKIIMPMVFGIYLQLTTQKHLIH